MPNPAQKVYKSIREVLLERGLITAEQSKEIELKLLKSGVGEEEIIRQSRILTDREIVEARAALYRVPFVDLDEVGFAPEALAYVPQSVAEKYKLIPYKIDQKEKQIFVVMANPVDLETVEFLEKKSGYKVLTSQGLESQIMASIREKYEREKGITSEVTKALDENKQDQIESQKQRTKINSEAPIAKIVSTILEFAVKARASDIHIEPQEDHVRVRYRIDGMLEEKYLLPRTVQDAVISRIKILSNLKIDEKRVPQDGRYFFSADVGGQTQDVDLRVSTLPTTYGEKIVMRLLRKSAKVPDLPELGLRGRALKNLLDAIARPHGIIIVCGPTGSGKTTTLYSVLHRVSTPKVNVSTIEDPVEYQIAGVSQVQVNVQAGLTFATALRSFLRQDPNIIMVGEIRDTETAELAINASLTGHLVFSTIHTNDAAGVPPRFLDLGIEPFLLVSSLTAVVGQRVMRKLCPHCAQEIPINLEQEQEFKNVLGNLYSVVLERFKKENKSPYIKKSVGCDQCNNSGYFGRIAIYEVMPISDKIGRLVLEKASAGAISKQAVEEGMLTMKQDGYVKVLEGVSTMEEVKRVAEY